MKKLINFLAILISATLFSQVAIGKNSVTNASVSLEFGSENRGLILPWVTDISTMIDSVPGTLVFNIADKKIKYKKDNGIWYDLTFNTIETNNNITIDTTGFVDDSAQKNLVEKPNAKVIIGQPNDSAPGILVLSDINKAMILPKVDSPHLNIINPSTGLIVYDTKMNQLAVFNGTVWTFWKP